MPEFIPGLELSRAFFNEVVQPILHDRYPSLRYAAALLGTGSEVLGYDTEMSTDHEWGPRVDLFLGEEQPLDLLASIDATLRDVLPATFRGFSTNFGAPDPFDRATRALEHVTAGPISHKIGIHTSHDFFQSYLGVDVRQPLEVSDWLTLPEQKLLTVSSGAVFHDEIGLEALRKRFHYHPYEVWLYLLASAWTRIGQEEHLMGRAGIVGDETGSAIIAARLTRDLMRLCFLMERVYAPYPKWFGTAFLRLRCATALTPHLRAALAADTWQVRERALVPAYELVASMHNDLGITSPLPANARRFFGRPFQVIALNGFAEAIVAQITDVSVRRLAQQPLVGGLDQLSDSTDLIDNPEFRTVLKQLWSSPNQPTSPQKKQRPRSGGSRFGRP